MCRNMQSGKEQGVKDEASSKCEQVGIMSLDFYLKGMKCMCVYRCRCMHACAPLCVLGHD